MKKLFLILLKVYFIGLIGLIGLNFASVGSTHGQWFDPNLNWALTLILILISSIVLALVIRWLSKRHIVTTNRKQSPYIIFLKIAFQTLILIVVAFVVFYIFVNYTSLRSLITESQYRASSINQLKKDVSGHIFLGYIPKDNWDKLEIANKLDHVDSIVYFYQPPGNLFNFLDNDPFDGVQADVKFNKDITSDLELKQLFSNALIASGITPLKDDPGVYCFKRTFLGYLKTDVLYISSINLFPVRGAVVSLKYGDSWSTCQKQFNLNQLR